MTSVLAMLYLALFSALALGFYAQTNLSAQVSGNEERVLAAQVAAESGLQFLRYQLSRVKVPPTVAPADVLEDVYDQLSARLDNTLNLGAKVVGYTGGAAPAIQIPSEPDGFIPLLKDGSRFRATITPVGGGKLRIKTVGRAAGGITRAIAMEFVEVPIRSPVLDYGVATRGTVSLSKAFILGTPDAARGSLLSTNTADSTAVELSGWTAEVGGDVYLSHPTGQVTGDGVVAGDSDDDGNWDGHVHPNTPAPEFPSADTSAYVAYLVGKETVITGSTGAAYLSNIRIRAGANPTFSGGGTYEGVILIEAPNQVTFSGGPTIRGVIVAANPEEASAGNKISFTGGTTVHGPETLPDSFGTLKAMKGSVVLAPNFSLDLSGGSTTFGGAVLAKAMTVTGGSGGTITGTVMLTGNAELSMTGGSTITIADGGAGVPPIPSGMRFTHTYAPYPATYLEVSP